MGSGQRRESLGRQLQGMFKVVENTTSSMTSGATRTGITPPNQPGKVYNVMVSAGSVRGAGVTINNLGLTNGEITTADVFNSATAQTVTLAWTFFGYF